MIALPPGIEPHKGRELELMLAGEKKAALFADFVNKDGVVDEATIPDKAFAPHVQGGRLRRFTHDKLMAGINRTHRTVVFTLPQEAWRANALFWLQSFHDDESDIMTGRLLGYSEADIAAYMAFQESTVR